MRKLIAALAISLGLTGAASAQNKFTMPPPAGVYLGGFQVVASCGSASGLAAGNLAFGAMDTTGAICTNATGGGGGGGLSVVDQSAFTQGTSPFTPGGCEYNDSTTLTSGQQGMVRCNSKRGFVVDTDSTGSNLYSAVTTPLNNSSVAINVASATTTQLVAISGSTVIYVTSYDIMGGGTGNATFVYGTGSNCGTGTTSLTGPYPITAQTGISKGSGIGTILKVPSGNALCLTTSTSAQMSGSVSYQQF